MDELQERYANQDEEQQESDEDDLGYGPGLMPPNNVIEKSLLPSAKDPKIWQVRVKKNFEKIAVMALLNKSIDFAKRGQPLSILSVTSSDSTEGFIFVEAFKETHVKEACAGLHFTFNSFVLLPVDQMPSVY